MVLGRRSGCSPSWSHPAPPLPEQPGLRPPSFQHCRRCWAGAPLRPRRHRPPLRRARRVGSQDSPAPRASPGREGRKEAPAPAPPGLSHPADSSPGPPPGHGSRPPRQAPAAKAKGGTRWGRRWGSEREKQSKPANGLYCTGKQAVKGSWSRHNATARPSGGGATLRWGPGCATANPSPWGCGAGRGSKDGVAGTGSGQETPAPRLPSGSAEPRGACPCCGQHRS